MFGIKFDNAILLHYKMTILDSIIYLTFEIYLVC